MRVPAAILGVILCVPLLAGCAKQHEPPLHVSLVVGICDPLCVDSASPCVKASAKRDYRQMAERVRERTGIELKLAYCALDGQLEAAIGGGQVQAAIGKVWPILRGRRGAARPFERLADLPAPDGQGGLSGVFITRRDSSLATLRDLAGRSLALGPSTDYEKSFAASAALQEAGVTPGPVKVLEGCVPVMAAVFERSLDAGVVSSYVADFGGLAAVGDPADFKVLGRTRAIPFITFAVSTMVDRAVRDRLRDALLEMHGQAAPQGLYSTGFTAPQPWEPSELEQR